MRNYWKSLERRARLAAAEQLGHIADSMNVRLALVKRVESGELTPSAAKAELAKIKRNARRNGKVTRAAAMRGELPPDIGAGAMPRPEDP